MLKIADFGLSRPLASGDLSPHVVTLWYRPPEVLWGDTRYGTAVDMWAAGCVCAEMHLRVRLFQGVSDVDQLGKIFHALGTPTEASWPGHRQLRCFVDWTPAPATPWDQILAGAPTPLAPRWRDLVERTVVACPARRAAAADLLK